MIMDEMVERFSLIRGSQHMFMGGRSTAINLLVYQEETFTRLIREGQCVDVLYLDFAREKHNLWLRREMRNITTVRNRLYVLLGVERRCLRAFIRGGSLKTEVL